MKTKRIIAGLIIVASVIAGINVSTKNVDAAVSETVIYEKWEDVDAAIDLLNGKKAPEFTGIDTPYTDMYEMTTTDTVSGDADYLFGGWYTIIANDESEYGYDSVPVSKAGDIDTSVVEEITGEIYVFAKWVPASLLSVKAQSTAGTESTTGKTNLRVISSVDSLDYEYVGFDIELENTTSLGDSLYTTKVYDKLEVASDKSYTADQIFGESAKYFAVWKLSNIASTNYSKIIYVKPYWVTADGVKVEGLPKYVHVEDGYNKYISVPVNLKDLTTATNAEGKVNGVAAGVFTVSYPSSLQLAGIDKCVETGRVFDELEYADKGVSGETGTIKFAANVATISENATENDIYVNLRFVLVDSAADVEHTSYDFNITDDPDFCDNGESKVTINIWDVLY